MRIGMGYDVHKLTENRRLVLGGVEIPYDKGLLGHSDADVLTHAVMDAILGALGLGDIGKLFPDTDTAYKDIDSTIMLDRVIVVMEAKGYALGNLDCTIVAQKPRLAPYIRDMEILLARCCRSSIDNVNVKATTEEGLGFTGAGEGIAAHAVVLLEEAAKGENHGLTGTNPDD